MVSVSTIYFNYKIVFGSQFKKRNFNKETMAASLGEKLRQAREERDISISEVSEQTRISALYLESIENDDYRTLPGGIFNKGFVKSFAKLVGVDEQEAMQDYSRLIAKQEVDTADDMTKSYRPEVLTGDSGSQSILPTIIFAAIILGLMTWGIIFLVDYFQNRESQTSENNIANNNIKVDNKNTNSNVNTGNSNSQPIPSTDEIKVEIKTTAEALAIATTADGKYETATINPELPRTVEAEESLKISYYKGLADTVQLTINGKKIETPLPPSTYRKNSLQYEINMSNIKQILRDGKINFGAPAAVNTNSNTANANAAPR